MRTGKELFNTLLVELNEMGLPGITYLKILVSFNQFCR